MTVHHAASVPTGLQQRDSDALARDLWEMANSDAFKHIGHNVHSDVRIKTAYEKG